MPPSCCHFSMSHTFRLHLNMAVFLHQIITVRRDCKQSHPGFPHHCFFLFIMTNLVFLYSDTTRIPLYSSRLSALAASPILPPVPAPTPDQRLLIFIFSILGKLRHKKPASISAHSMKARLFFQTSIFIPSSRVLLHISELSHINIYKNCYRLWNSALNV